MGASPDILAGAIRDTLTQPMIASPDTQPLRAYRIKFPTPFLDDRRTHWRWKGEGGLTLAEGSVTLTGKRARSFWFAKPQAQTFRNDQIRDVQRDGATLSCVVYLEGRKPEPLTVRFDTEADAEQVAAAWPATVSQELQDRRAFAEQLSQAGVRPLATSILIGLCALAFVVISISGVSILDPDSKTMVAWGTNYGPLTLHEQPWRVVSSLFLHFGLLHLFLNMLGLWNVGRVVEQLLGTARFVALYLLAGVGGSLASLAWNPLANSAGASGAIFGVMGALLALMLHGKTRVPPTVARSLRTSTLAFIAYNVIYGLSHAGIDNAAHVGGLASGFALGWVLARPMGAERARGLDRTLVMASLVAVLMMIGGLHALQGRYGDRLSLFSDLEPVYAIEAKAVRVEAELTHSRDTQQLAPTDWAHQLLINVKPQWEEANELASRLRDDAVGHRRKVLSDVQHYLQLRVLHTELSAESVLERDQEKRAWAEEAQRRIDALTAQIRSEIEPVHH